VFVDSPVVASSASPLTQIMTSASHAEDSISTLTVGLPWFGWIGRVRQCICSRVQVSTRAATVVETAFRGNVTPTTVARRPLLARRRPRLPRGGRG